MDNAQIDKLFVYGIFLDESQRNMYGMVNPRYAVVPDYATVIKVADIVQAVSASEEYGLGLTGLLVDIPTDKFEELDRLEGAYDRIKVKTTSGEAWMYVAKD